MGSSTQKLETIRCKAAVCWGAEEMVVEEIEVAPPRESEVRVKMLCASLCHTDVLYQKGFPFPLYPRVLGHEGVGVVESVGEGVTDFKEGDTVIPTYVGECGECTNCLSPNSSNNFCTKFPPSFLTGLMPDGTSRMSSRGHELYHFFTCSTLSEYTVVNVNYLLNIPSPIPLPHASLLTCGYSTGFGAAWKEAKVEKGSSIAVFGLGAVGLGVVEGSRVCGATKIIGVDVNELKREKGEAFGITQFLNPREMSEKSSMAEVIKEMTGGLGVDYSFECTGAGPLMYDAMECTKTGQGLTIMIGSGMETSINLNIFPFFAGKTLKGTIFGGLRPRSDLPYIINKSINKELHLEELVTHQVQLGEINFAFDQLLKQPDSIKIIIQFGNEGVSG